MSLAAVRSTSKWNLKSVPMTADLPGAWAPSTNTFTVEPSGAVPSTDTVAGNEGTSSGVTVKLQDSGDTSTWGASWAPAADANGNAPSTPNARSATTFL